MKKSLKIKVMGTAEKPQGILKFLDNPQVIEKIEKEMTERIERGNQYRKQQNNRISLWVKDKSNKEILLMIKRVVGKHDEKYHMSFRNKSVEPYPNNLLFAILNFIEKNGEELPESRRIDFPHSQYRYGEYKFISIHGQGICRQLYRKTTLLISI